MGLLDSMPQQGMPQAAPQMGGLLGAAPPQMPQAQGMQAPSQGTADPIQLLTSLSKTPTPEVAKSIIMQLQSDKSPGATQFVQVLTQAMNNPAMLKQIADAGLQKAVGAQNAGQ